MKKVSADPRTFTAKILLTAGQTVGVAAVACSAAIIATLLSLVKLLSLAVTVVIVAYALFIALRVITWLSGALWKPPVMPMPPIDDPELPRYSILVPLFRETEVFTGLVRSLGALRYPVEKLEILLLLEADDELMLDVVQRAELPMHFKKIVIPSIGPQTKPKACNYAMSFVKGEHVVIFDAEDRPEPNHLLKAHAAMRMERKKDPRVVCMQAMLRFWNPHSGLASRYYWAEYVVHFQWMLPGMQRLGLIPPLGGTSNHFIVAALWDVAAVHEPLITHHHGKTVRIPSIWDSYNVTEDADLAARLAREGFRIGLFDAVTFEEAPHRLGIALKQRTRWLQGYLMTGLVHLREPVVSIRQMGLVRYLAFALTMLGTPLLLAMNPIMWACTIGYVVAKVNSWGDVTKYFDGLFTPSVLQLGMAIMIIGNFTLFVQKLTTVLYVADGRETGVAKWLLLTPLWWGFTSLSAYRAVWRLLTARSVWEKTPHGHDQGIEDQFMVGHDDVDSVNSASRGGRIAAVGEPQ